MTWRVVLIRSFTSFSNWRTTDSSTGTASLLKRFLYRGLLIKSEKFRDSSAKILTSFELSSLSFRA
ncbi:hypothetical protein MtrunA17_Chr7g0235171 [Medicago truncatula]|uniref:Uncharacterized protein n=1 Tax=Medicago truncatula TaxID=3880 RepID=A0A396GXB8_MEDTR|nr:hypothetical protein MtrunA17_Chr7g0235171 [Medicago truncatula]